MKQFLSTLSLGTVRQWHWISSAVCLVGMILFAFTGITLNHAADIKADTQVESLELELSETLLKTMTDRSEGPLPLAVRQWLVREHGVKTPNTDAEWDGSEVYLGMPKPGGDAWLSIDLAAKQAIGEIYTNTSEDNKTELYFQIYKDRSILNPSLWLAQ